MAKPNTCQMSPQQIDAAISRLDSDISMSYSKLYRLQAYLSNDPKSSRSLSAVQLANAERDLRQEEARNDRLRDERTPYADEYRLRGGWLRYFLVANTGGHIHRDTCCATCFDSTNYVWLTNLSDEAVETMVAHYGETACTVCFPEAPVMKGFGEYNARHKAERAAERAAAKAAKDAVAVFHIGTGRRLFKTERAAEIEMVGSLVYAIEVQASLDDGTAPDHWGSETREKAEANAFVIACGLASKRDITPEAVIESLSDRAWKKYKRDKREGEKAAARFKAHWDAMKAQ